MVTLIRKNYKIRTNGPDSTAPDSIDGGGIIQIDQLPIALDNARANLPRRLALLIHRVSVIKLFEAGSTLGAMRAGEATVQALVSHAAVTVAVAGLLVEHLWNLCREFISVRLIRKLRIRAPQLILTQELRKLCPRCRCTRIEMRHALIGFRFKPRR